MGINHGGLHVLVAEKFLNSPDVVAAFQELRGKRMPECVTGGPFGHVGSDAARGLAVRMDHGTQYLSDHFQNQLKFWGIAPSFAFLEEPQTNGVAERFFRTLKEQVIYGRVFRTIAEVRQAVAAFVERYNQQ